MNTEQIEFKKQEIIKQFGGWTGHTIHLKDHVWTHDQSSPQSDEQISGYGTHLRRIFQSVSDITNQPLDSLRVLDLACLEGMYGIEFARHGAEVVGIEGRKENIEKASFAKDALSLNNITFVQDDVRNLSIEKYGRFDVVLCLGILYHLDVPDLFNFVERMAEVCQRVTIIDTHVGLRANKSYIYKGQEYLGWTYVEHEAETTSEERLKKVWASLDNEKSFWFTRPSLFNLLSEAGFTSVYTCHNPAVPWQKPNRDTLVAIKGQRRELLSTPPVNSMPDKRWPEYSQVGQHPSQQDCPEYKQQNLLRRGRNLARRIVNKVTSLHV